MSNHYADYDDSLPLMWLMCLCVMFSSNRQQCVDAFAYVVAAMREAGLTTRRSSESRDVDVDLTILTDLPSPPHLPDHFIGRIYDQYYESPSST